MAAEHVNDNIRYERTSSHPHPGHRRRVSGRPDHAGPGGPGRGHRAPDCRPAPGIHGVGVFAALLVSGVSTIMQAVRVGRIGSGHILFMGTSGAFIAVCIGALAVGGPATMASLIVISSLIQFLLASRLALLRRIFTPAVTGTVIMLIAVTIVPLLFDALSDVPEGSPDAAAPVAALLTLTTVVALVLRAPPAWRLWSR